MRTAAIVLLCTTVLFVASCKSKAKPSVVGKWQSEAGNQVEFRADGTSRVGSTEGKYRLADEQTIEILHADGRPAGQWKIISLTDSKLIINMQGTQNTLQRVK